MDYKFQHVPVAITPAEGDGPVAILYFITVGRGSHLPDGATWLDEAGGWWQREASDANIFSQVVRSFAGNGRPTPQGYRIVHEGDIPTDRTYRNAWVHDGSAIVHDMVKARELHLDLVRNARTEALGELDKQWMKAMGQGDREAATAAEAQRQALRDAPQALDVASAKTVDDLKKLWPAELAVPADLAAAGVEAADAVPG